jgi:hypothetical protein
MVIFPAIAQPATQEAFRAAEEVFAELANNS